MAENESFTGPTPTLTGTPIGEVAWTLDGADAADFTIAAATGVVSMVPRDYENPQDANVDNDYEVTVTATDADGNIAPAVPFTVTVTNVRETATLTITGLTNRSVAENESFTGPTPALTGTPIGEVAWTLDGADAADFTIAAATGVVSMVPRDYENPQDANVDNVYEVTVTATDADGNIAPAVPFTVTVTNVRETATLTITGLTNRSVAENESFTGPTPALTGTPIGEVAWTLDGADAADFTIAAATGVVSMVPRDYENPQDANVDNVYEVTVTATDADGNIAPAVPFTVTVTNVRETATLTITGLTNRSVAENESFTGPTPTLTGTPIGEVAWTLDGADAADFTIAAATGVVSMVPRDFENPQDANVDNDYEVTVTATDADGNIAPAVPFTVTVTNVRETATLTITGLTNRSVAENESFTGPTPTLTGTPIGEVAWTLDGADAADFTIAAATGVVSMVPRDFENPQDANVDNDYEVTVTATDADGNIAPAVPFTVTVTNVRETATLTITGLTNRSVAENESFTGPTPALTGTPIGEVAWTLDGADAADFTIAAATGVVSMVPRDYENPQDANVDNVYEVTVTATDADGNIAPAVPFTVTVTNVRETATLTITGLTNRSVAENDVVHVGAPTLTGTPVGSVTWSLDGNDASAFTIDAASGVVSMVVRDFEDPQDANADNVYEVSVTATDTDGNAAPVVPFTVTVTNVVETATFTITGLTDQSVAENAPFTGRRRR